MHQHVRSCEEKVSPTVRVGRTHHNRLNLPEQAPKLLDETLD
jgi:hypothetical protein